MAQVRENWLAFVKKAMKHSVALNERNVFIS